MTSSASSFIFFHHLPYFFHFVLKKVGKEKFLVNKQKSIISKIQT